jgi:hypothetical protein
MIGTGGPYDSGGSATEPLDKELLRESIKEFIAIMNSEWVDEGELSSKEIQIRTASLPIRCKIQGNWIDALYNPTVGANLISSSFAHAFLGNEPLAPTCRTMSLASRSCMGSKGVLHDARLHMDDIVLALDFHVFDIQDFDMCWPLTSMSLTSKTSTS